MTDHARPPKGGITLYTMGFTKKAAQDFFPKLMDAGVQRVIDIRLNNRSTLAGFTKSPDLEYFLKVIAGIGFQDRPPSDVTANPTKSSGNTQEQLVSELAQTDAELTEVVHAWSSLPEPIKAGVLAMVHSVLKEPGR